MITTQFFAEPDFLEFLRFWDSRRGDRILPEWDDDLGAIPDKLLPNLVITDRRAGAIYAYVGAECIRRWGSDPTGLRVFSEVLSGAHRRYVKSVGDEAMARRAPIFSTAVYEPNAVDIIMTGRLYLPFSYGGSTEPSFMMTLQLFRGSEYEMRRIGLSGIVHEISRYLIVYVPVLCDRMEAARRDYQISRHTHQRTLTEDIDAVIRQLIGSAIVPLPCLEEPEQAAGA